MKGVRVRAPFFVSGRGWRCWPILRDTFGADPPAATMIECGLIDPKYGIENEVTALLPGQVTFCPLDGAGEIGHIGPKVSEA